MKIKHVTWLGADGCIGIVVTENEVTKEKKARICLVSGQDEEYDTKFIAERGGTVSVKALKAIIRAVEN